jgi:hypothetical protein
MRNPTPTEVQNAQVVMDVMLDAYSKDEALTKRQIMERSGFNISLTESTAWSYTNRAIHDARNLLVSNYRLAMPCSTDNLYYLTPVHAEAQEYVQRGLQDAQTRLSTYKSQVKTLEKVGGTGNRKTKRVIRHIEVLEADVEDLLAEITPA